MAERVIFRQNSNFEALVLAPDPADPESEHLHPVEHIHALTPYGMLLLSLGSCTAIVLHTYAQHHDVDLQEVEMRMSYHRDFQEDCENCENIDEYTELVEEEIRLSGDLTHEQRRKLEFIAHHCPIEKILKDGIPVKSYLSDQAIE